MRQLKTKLETALQERKIKSSTAISFGLVGIVVLVTLVGSFSDGITGKFSGGQLDQGNLYVVTVPEKAHVYMDDQYLGVTPVRITGLKPGYNSVIITKPGYLDYKITKYVESKGTTTIAVKMKPLDQV